MMNFYGAKWRSSQRRMWHEEQEVLHNHTLLRLGQHPAAVDIETAAPAPISFWGCATSRCTEQKKLTNTSSIYICAHKHTQWVSQPVGCRLWVSVLRVLATDYSWAGAPWIRTHIFLSGRWNMKKRIPETLWSLHLNLSSLCPWKPQLTQPVLQINFNRAYLPVQVLIADCDHIICCVWQL